MRGIHRRWIVLVGCLMATLCLGGTQWAFGVFFRSFEGEFGWSRATVSSIFVLLIVGYSISAVLAGRISDRHNPRPVLLVSAAVIASSLLYASQAHVFSHLGLAFFVAGLGGGATLSIPFSVVQRWFVSHRRSGMALAVVMSGVGIGGAVFAPLLNHLVQSQGWRFAIGFAGLMFGALVAVAGLMVRAGPQGSARHDTGDGSTGSSLRDASIRRILTSMPFVALVYTTVIALFTFQVLSVHFVPLAVDIGATETAAAAALGMLGGASVPGRLLAGSLHSRLGWQRTLVFALVLTGSALVLLLRATGPGTLYVFVVLYGLAHGMRAVSLVGMLGQRFGTGSLGQLIGTTVAFSQMAAAVAPYVAGALFDRTASYAMILGPLALLLIAGAVLVLLQGGGARERGWSFRRSGMW